MKEHNLKPGDRIIEINSRYWSSNRPGNDYSLHVVESVTPTGRIKTKSGLHLDKHLLPMGKSRSSSINSKYSVLTDELSEDIKHEELKEMAFKLLEKLKPYSMTVDQLEKLIDFLEGYK